MTTAVANESISDRARRSGQTLLQIRAPVLLLEAIGTAASKRLLSRSAYVRCVLLDRLREDGLAFDARELPSNRPVSE
jgi:hypothetical protein